MFWKRFYSACLLVIYSCPCKNLPKYQRAIKAMLKRALEYYTIAQGEPEALSESPRCNDMVADLHFPRFFGTAIKCEIARRFPRSVVKVGLHVQCKNISISSAVQP